MKYLQNIILIIILLFCTAKQCNSVENISTERILTLPTNSGDNSNSLKKNYILLSSIQNLISLGEEGGINMSLRVQYSNERNQSAKKTPFKFIKSEKNIDGNLHHFYITDITAISGVFSTVRYLFFIKRLRI